MSDDELTIGTGRPKILARLTLELDETGGLMVDGEPDPVTQLRMAEILIEGLKARGFQQYLQMKAARDQKIVGASADVLNGGKLQMPHGPRSN